jgi:hypothetical protein
MKAALTIHCGFVTRLATLVLVTGLCAVTHIPPLLRRNLETTQNVTKNLPLRPGILRRNLRAAKDQE